MHKPVGIQNANKLVNRLIREGKLTSNQATGLAEWLVDQDSKPPKNMSANDIAISALKTAEVFLSTPRKIRRGLFLSHGMIGSALSALEDANRLLLRPENECSFQAHGNLIAALHVIRECKYKIEEMINE
ncbi:MAG: hypothetical protein ACRBB4_01500 [Neptuniibacter sp.]